MWKEWEMKTVNAWENCIKRDLQRIGEEWTTISKDKSWRRDRERSERKVRKEKTKKMRVSKTNLIPDDRGAKRGTTSLDMLPCPFICHLHLNLC